MTEPDTADWTGPAGNYPCPPTPSEVPAAVKAAATKQDDLQETVFRRKAASTHGAYDHLATEYQQRLAEAAEDRDRLRVEMRAFGGYLRDKGVPPEHIVPCVRAALAGVRQARRLGAESRFGRDVVTWTIEGYYGLDSAGA